MRRIYKYELKVDDEQVIKVPKLSGTSSFKDQVLKLDVQYGIPCLWCLVDIEQPERNVRIRTVGTGNNMPNLTKNEYLGSYLLYEGRLVFHVFLEE